MNLDCYLWVDAALERMRNEGGPVGRRLLNFFEDRDFQLGGIPSLSPCFPRMPHVGLEVELIFVPEVEVAGTASGGRTIRLYFEYVPVVWTNVVFIHDYELGILAHELEHIRQQARFPRYRGATVQREALAYIVGYEVMSALGPLPPRGFLFQIVGGEHPCPLGYKETIDPYDTDELLRFRVALNAFGGDSYPESMPIYGGYAIPEDWLVELGIKWVDTDDLSPSEPPPSEGTGSVPYE